ncbi:MAG: amidase [Acidobacteria bacterium]|nr:amidase [Acidobacteriota bacterium]
MSNAELCTLTIEVLSQRLRQKEVSPIMVVEAYLERIDAMDRQINAYITVMRDQALADACRYEQEILAGEYRGPLHGVPIALKDLYDIGGVPTTAASKIYADRVADEDAPSVARLRKAGAIILGKTNLHEFAYGATTEHSYFGPTRNPWDLERIPGGSSGGSGAAVAAGLCAVATGSDTGGSIRIPAALCGIVGIKPTYGRISCRGLVPLSWTMDHPGPLTRSVYDAAVMLEAMAGYDPRDPASVDRPVPNFTTSLRDGVHGLRVGIDPKWALYRIDSEVRTAFEAALVVLKDMGAEVVELSLSQIPEATEAALTILASEAAAIHEEFLHSRPQDYNANVHIRLEQGFLIRGVDYARARRVGQCLQRDLEEVFEMVNLIATPTCSVTAPKFGQQTVLLDGGETPVTAALTRFTRIFNLTGMPTITVPCGLSLQGLPIGLQLAGAVWNEEMVLRAAYTYEQATEWRHCRPLLAAGN